jgi:hypothetical protein
MIRSDLIENLAERKSIHIRAAEAIVHELFSSMADSLIAGTGSRLGVLAASRFVSLKATPVEIPKLTLKLRPHQRRVLFLK